MLKKDLITSHKEVVRKNAKAFELNDELIEEIGKKNLSTLKLEAEIKALNRTISAQVMHIAELEDTIQFLKESNDSKNENFARLVRTAQEAQEVASSAQEVASSAVELYENCKSKPWWRKIFS